jgi:hypothetical protein
MVYGYIFIISIIAITEIIVGVKRISAFFPILSLITAKGLIGFLRNNNNTVRKKKNRLKKKKKRNCR